MEGKNITGKIIKELRREKRLKMYELGEAIGVSKSCISNYESGYNIPSRENLLKLSEFFSVNVDYLLGKTEFRDRFLKYIIGMKVPIFDDDDIESLVSCNESKITGIINIPRLNGIEKDILQTFAVKITDTSMEGSELHLNGYAIAVRSEKILGRGVAVVVYDNKIYLRRLHCFEDRVTLIPDGFDKSYMPIQVNKSDIKILGYVKRVINNID